MMSNEELERKMEFIVNQQAKFSVEMDKLREWDANFAIKMDKRHAQFEIDLDRLRDVQELTILRIHETNEVVTRLAYVTTEGFKDVNAKLNALVDAQLRTDEKLNKLSDTVDEKLNKLSDTVDRYIRNRHNGTG